MYNTEKMFSKSRPGLRCGFAGLPLRLTNYCCVHRKVKLEMRVSSLGSITQVRMCQIEHFPSSCKVTQWTTFHPRYHLSNINSLHECLKDINNRQTESDISRQSYLNVHNITPGMIVFTHLYQTKFTTVFTLLISIITIELKNRHCSLFLYKVFQ